jgi:serine/threonine protein kinase
VTSRVGQLLSGRYHLLESLGDGGMGSVWKAHDSRLERTVAVKELIPGRLDPAEAAVQRERVRHEALALAAIEHPVIVTIHDLLYDGREQDPWIVMAYVHGRPLDRLISQAAPLDEREIARVGLAVAHGLTACHERGVYHRDVKPANIVRCDDGSVRLVDFGIARIVGKAPLTAADRVVGTLEFLAPELLNGDQAGPMTDLWALGVTLYYALAGRAPFTAESVSATLAAIAAREPREPRAGSALSAFVLRMLSKDPEARPDAAAAARALRDIASGQRLSVPRLSVPRLSAPQPSAPRPSAPRPGGPKPRPPDPAPPARSVPPSPPPRPGERAGPGRPAPPSRVPCPAAAEGAARAEPRDQGRTTTPLAGLPLAAAVRAVSDPANSRAAADLLGLDRGRAATIINRCPDPAAGRLLSAIAADTPAVAWRFLDMIPPERAGQLLDHMSSLASAAVLAVPPSRSALGLLSRADNLTVVSALSEMAPRAAAALLAGMDDDERAARLLLATANPGTVARILESLGPPGRGRSVLRLLPAEFRELVTRSAGGALPAARLTLPYLAAVPDGRPTG